MHFEKSNFAFCGDFCYNIPMERITGFPPVAGVDCRFVILGTAPSAESLRAGYYYAHPRNAFWRVLADTFGAPVPETAGEKAALLLENRLALWDVLCACVRRGSLDSAIREPEGNDFSAFSPPARALRACFSTARRPKGFFSASAGRRSRAARPCACPPPALPARSLTLENWSFGERNFCDDEEHTAQ